MMFRLLFCLACFDDFVGALELLPPECRSWSSCFSQPRSAMITRRSVGIHNNAADEVNRYGSRDLSRSKSLSGSLSRILESARIRANPVIEGGKHQSNAQHGMRSTLPIMSATHLHPWKINPSFSSEPVSHADSLTDDCDKRCRSRQRSRLRSVLTMMFEASSADVKPGFVSGIRKCSKPYTALAPVVGGYSSDVSPFDFVLETTLPETLTAHERNEAMEKCGMDWINGNPAHPAYDRNRIEDVIILAKDRGTRELIGFAYGRRVNPDLWWLDKFMVVSGKQGRGVGSQLVRQILEYIVSEKRGKALFSSTQVHRVSSLKAQSRGHSLIMDEYFPRDKDQTCPVHGVGYYHLDPVNLQDPFSALVLLPLVKDITQADLDEWSRIVARNEYYPSVSKSPRDLKGFLSAQGFTSKFQSDDPLKVLVGILEEQGCPSDLAEELARMTYPIVNSLE